MGEYLGYTILAICIALTVGLPILFLRGKQMLISMVAFIATLVMSVFLVFSLLGKPNYANIITRTLNPNMDAGKVLWVSIDMKTKQIIMLVLDISKPGSIPFYMYLPFTQNNAEKIQEGEQAKDKAIAEGKAEPSTMVKGLMAPKNPDIIIMPGYKPLSKPTPNIKSLGIN